uniref:Uncharacterized protein LOC110203791 isoform X2 n=1 Tax=Phascolarctos cinereus TaxID=38626 RepID=A0A6P5JNP5_PHACI|nr:uncharacterized protein LOC110203791 isoform X2 [Phascolarctos cinereus]
MAVVSPVSKWKGSNVPALEMIRIPFEAHPNPGRGTHITHAPPSCSRLSRTLDNGFHPSHLSPPPTGNGRSLGAGRREGGSFGLMSGSRPPVLLFPRLLSAPSPPFPAMAAAAAYVVRLLLGSVTLSLPLLGAQAPSAAAAASSSKAVTASLSAKWPATPLLLEASSRTPG